MSPSDFCLFTYKRKQTTCVYLILVRSISPILAHCATYGGCRRKCWQLVEAWPNLIHWSTDWAAQEKKTFIWDETGLGNFYVRISEVFLAFRSFIIYMTKCTKWLAYLLMKTWIFAKRIEDHTLCVFRTDRVYSNNYSWRYELWSQQEQKILHNCAPTHSDRVTKRLA